jgi:adenylylsulfate kinase
MDSLEKVIRVEKLVQPWTVWITGLSGSGKTTISKELIQILDTHSVQHHYFRLDDIRQFLTPNPTFSKEEREFVYRAAIFGAKILNDFGINTIIDSVDGQGAGRQLGQQTITNFGVIQVTCPLDECIRREQHRTDRAEIVDLYQRALQGQLKLAGMGLDYYIEKSPLLEVDSFNFGPDYSAELISTRLELQKTEY